MFKRYLDAHFAEAHGQVSGFSLFPETHERGCYRGNRQVVRKRLAAPQAGTAQPTRAGIAPADGPESVP
ncbi:hypothetical protein OG946_34640 [Streptomyces sp. NBC_01808]|uniref:hypothetical protein n=1 Tax=Streptomyces sp. NBC_01808 TaxID=2975947 RepID=UPI002DDB48F4|nr:hypothetical protein [Streptomyces sp. NBC_01808]WSA42061.1 hypothetical protein OG946_34640 [Streptomyces sp. NBC_01808]